MDEATFSSAEGVDVHNWIFIIKLLNAACRVLKSVGLNGAKKN